MSKAEEPAFNVIFAAASPADFFTGCGAKILINGKELQAVESFDYKIDGLDVPDSVVRTRITLTLFGAQVGTSVSGPAPSNARTDE